MLNGLQGLPSQREEGPLMLASPDGQHPSRLPPGPLRGESAARLSNKRMHQPGRGRRFARPLARPAVSAYDSLSAPRPRR